jgi:co-chaperonin GroES (HSP10)
MLQGGDVLARGGKSAQFGGVNAITDFENDVIYMNTEEVCVKYGLSEAEYDQYQKMRLDGERLPDLPAVKDLPELGSEFSITDHRKNYMLDVLPSAEPTAEEAKKYPDPTFDVFRPILDRLLVMRINDNPEEEVLEDGSTRNKRTGIITSAKYRQHSNIGIVLGLGKYVVLSGLRFDITEFVKLGDKVTFGDYNSEVFPMEEKKARALCDELQVNYVPDPKGLRVVRVQDVRGVEPRVPVEDTSKRDAFVAQYQRHGYTCNPEVPIKAEYSPETIPNAKLKEVDGVCYISDEVVHE